ncbi:MAG TPA: STT3 domain-containing protein [Thermoanaerobaculia bacterium]|jgi:asparagine N-glycosylation enzyme membrane subunit Stt3|nr:STT3 domain-containing protein [Thermoanaerobaculia bacterium]
MARENFGSRESGVGSRNDDGARASSDPRPPTPDPRLLALAFFVLALAVRLLNAPFIFDGSGKPRIAPVDELYHWKRIAYSAAHFPQALEFDPDRGIGGAFCPWPPLYDVASGGAARLLGAANADEVLTRVVWFPPLLFALFAGITVFALAVTGGTRMAILCGIALATSPFLVTPSWIGSIDHHFLEPVLTFAILGAACLGLHARNRREHVRAGLLLAIAITAAMFVQTALLISAALAFVVLFLWSDGVAATLGFGIAAMAVALYRLTRAPGFPENQWFLGWTHVALFAAAALACVVQAVGRRSGVGSRGSGVGATAMPETAPTPDSRLPTPDLRQTFFALLAGIGVLLAFPSVPSSLLNGVHFFGGDRWLKTIQEFQPLWRAHSDDLLSDLTGLSGGVVLVWFLLARATRTRDRVRLAVALFAIVYLGLTITSIRFWIVAIPLLALAGALYVPLIAPKRRLALLAALAIALPPPLQLAGWLMTPIPPVKPNQQPWLRATSFLRTLPPGRVLGPWSMGHAIDVEGKHAVVIDNFGTMPDTSTFEHAEEALLAPNEAMLARYCDAAGVHYLILETPRFGIASANAILGTRQAQESTWWWHVWRGEQPRLFRLLWSEPGLRIYRR